MKLNCFLAGLWVAGLCLNTACSDNESLIDLPTNGNNEEGTEIVEQSPFTILDKQGCTVEEFSAGFNEYYVQVNVPGKWRLSTDTDFLVPLQEEGEGPALVRMYVGANWFYNRTGHISLQQLDADATTRGGAAMFTPVLPLRLRLLT